MYKRVIKRLLDIILSVLAIITLALPMLVIVILIKIDDPGPALFKQKRIGKNKNGSVSYFMMWKFRSMKMSAPSEVPTHLLEGSTEYITHVGKFIRKTSLDELPQFYQVLSGKLSLVGPRPALWNQTDLYCERERYGANDVLPGITGWAQINGRDEVEISDKAKLDGEYAERLNAGRFKGFAIDIKCIFGTFFSVLGSKGVVEGGTGELKRRETKKKDENIYK